MYLVASQNLINRTLTFMSKQKNVNKFVAKLHKYRIQDILTFLGFN